MNKNARNSYDFARSWVRHWWPKRHQDNGRWDSPRNTCRAFIQNAKVYRWLLGGKYPTPSKIDT